MLDDVCGTPTSVPRDSSPVISYVRRTTVVKDCRFATPTVLGVSEPVAYQGATGYNQNRDLIVAAAGGGMCNMVVNLGDSKVECVGDEQASSGANLARGYESLVPQRACVETSNPNNMAAQVVVAFTDTPAADVNRVQANGFVAHPCFIRTVPGIGFVLRKA